MNTYDSKETQLLGMDMYNLPMPVAPPSDLVLSQSSVAPSDKFCTRFLGNRLAAGNISAIGFATNDRPYLRGIGLFSNMADGLVNNTTRSEYTGGALALNLKLQRLGPRLSNDGVGPASISVVAGFPAVIGTNTLFTQDLAPGMTIYWLDDGFVLRSGIISVITDDTNLDLIANTEDAGMFQNNTTNSFYVRPRVAQAGNSVTYQVPTLNKIFPVSFFMGDISKVRPIRGLVSFMAGNTIATGKQTRFLSDVTVGQYLRYTGDVTALPVTVRVASIQSDTQLTLSVPGAGVAGVPTLATDVSLGLMDAFLAIESQMTSFQLAFATISIDPGFGPPTAKRLSFATALEVESTFDQSGTF